MRQHWRHRWHTPHLRRLRLAIAVATTLGVVATGVPRAVAVPTVRWQRTAGIELEAVARAGGDAVVTGNVVRSGERFPGLLVRRYDRSGTVVWSRTWHPKGTRVDGLDVAVGPDGAVYVVGDIARANLEGGGFFLRKYSGAGTHRWTVVSDGGYGRGVGIPERATGVAVQGRTVVVVGFEYGCCGDVTLDGWVKAFRDDGVERWTRDVEVPGVPRATNDIVLDVATDATGLYLAGRVEATARLDDTVRVDAIAIVQKRGFGGGARWTWRMKDPESTKDNDTATGIAVRDGRVFATGYGNSRSWARSQGWLVQLTAKGARAWLQPWGRPQHRISPTDVAITPASDALVTGGRRATDPDVTALFIRKVAANGDLVDEGTIDGGAHDVGGTGVAHVGGGAYVSGWSEVSDEVLVGRLWRFDI